MALWTAVLPIFLGTFLALALLAFMMGKAGKLAKGPAMALGWLFAGTRRRTHGPARHGPARHGVACACPTCRPPRWGRQVRMRRPWFKRGGVTRGGVTRA